LTNPGVLVDLRKRSQAMFNYATEAFSAKEKIEILFKEYDTLRAEIINRASGGNQVVAILAGLFGASLAWRATHPPDRIFWTAIAVLFCTGVFLMATAYRDINLVARRLAVIERTINKLSGDDLLAWESRFGSMAGGWVARKNSHLIEGPPLASS
jgi:hypothetical protein